MSETIMLTYFAIALLINLICGLTNLTLRNAPARLRFYIGVLALASWLVPWHLLQIEATSTQTISVPDILLNIRLAEPAIDIAQSASFTEWFAPKSSVVMQIFSWTWFLVFTLGIAMFCIDVIRYIRLHKHLKEHSVLDNDAWKTSKINPSKYDIRRVNCTLPGMTTGLFRPIIWINNAYSEPEEIRTIVMHELRHILQRDQFWLWVINFTQRLFWWNPIVRRIAKYTKEQMELSCDEQCKENLPQGTYQLQLIKLALQVSKRDSMQMPMVLHMSSSSSFNLQRIKSLNEERKMKKRHVVLMATLLSLTTWIGFSNATVNLQQGVSNVKDQHSFEYIVEALNNNDLPKAKSLLQGMVENLEKFDSAEQAKIWQLYSMALYQEENKHPLVLPYIDKALSHEASLPIAEKLSLLHNAQSFAASQERWEKQLAYSKRWLAIGQGDSRESQVMFHTALSHYFLAQFDQSITILDELIAKSEAEGSQVQEQWLGILGANHALNENWSELAMVYQKQSVLYPSEKNVKQFEELAHFLN